MNEVVFLLFSFLLFSFLKFESKKKRKEALFDDVFDFRQ
jgi:hypothetical protein